MTRIVPRVLTHGSWLLNSFFRDILPDMPEKPVSRRSFIAAASASSAVAANCQAVVVPPLISAGHEPATYLAHQRAYGAWAGESPALPDHRRVGTVESLALPKRDREGAVDRYTQQPLPCGRGSVTLVREYVITGP